MTARDIFNGSTGNRAVILILNNADGTPKTGVAYDAAGLSISYRVGTGSAVAITLTSGNWFEIGGCPLFHIRTLTHDMQRYI